MEKKKKKREASKPSVSVWKPRCRRRVIGNRIVSRKSERCDRQLYDDNATQKQDNPNTVPCDPARRTSPFVREHMRVCNTNCSKKKPPLQPVWGFRSDSPPPRCSPMLKLPSRARHTEASATCIPPASC